MKEEKRYYYMACENVYHGLHGMYTSGIVEGTVEDVNVIAVEESYNVMESYGSIMDDLQDEVNDMLESGDYTEDEAWDEVMTNNVEFYVWEIDEEKASGISTQKLEEISADYGYEIFVDEYCKK